MSEAPKSHRIAAPRINNNINVRSSCVNLDFCTCLPFLVIATGEWSPRPFCGAEVRSWPITSFVPFCVWRLPVEADTRYLGGPASGGVALYLAAKRPLDRARKRSRPIRVTIAPPRIRRHTLRPLPRRKQSGLEPLSRLHAAPWQPHQLISGRAPTARTKILHTRGSLAPRWMGLISRTAD